MQNRRMRGPRKTMDVHQGAKSAKNNAQSAFNQTHTSLKKGDSGLQIPLLHLPGQRLHETNDSASSKGIEKSISSSLNHVILERPRAKPKAMMNFVG